MLDQLDRAWRIIATGVAFAAFGLGGVLLRLMLFPLLQLIRRDPAMRVRDARLLLHRSLQLFVFWMRLLGLLRYDIHGQERLQRQGLLVLANHPSLLDVVLMIALLPNADCVVRSSLARNPFTRGPIRAAGYICNDSGAGLIQDCIASIRAGSNLVIFPEGTRTPVNGTMRLQRGAANIAVRGGLDMTLVSIHCEPRSLTKGQPWWIVPARRMHFTITVHDDLSVQPFIEAAQGKVSIATRRLTDYLQHQFTLEHSRHAGA